ncbi:MAG: sulfatase-like hydrolase/transferase, partial [Elusimicrobiota bacterium]
APFQDNFGRILDWMKKEQGQPFFLFAAIDDLHVPYHSDDPDKYDPGYEGVARDTDVYSVPFARAYNGEASGYPERFKAKAAEFKRDPKHLRHFVARYDAALNQVDRRVGEFVEQLKRLGLDQNTVLIISADHGETLGEHGLLNHTQGLYEPVLRVPLIIRHPGLPESAGRRVDKQVQRIDLMPTILDIAGASYAHLELQGRSFVPLLKDPAAPWREYAFARSKRNLARFTDMNLDERIVRTRCWKLHHYLYKSAYELYDICSDPLEQADLAAKRPDMVSALSFQLLRNMEISRPHQPGLPSGQSPNEGFKVVPPKD